MNAGSFTVGLRGGYSYSYSSRWDHGTESRVGRGGSSTSTALRAEYEYERKSKPRSSANPHQLKRLRRSRTRKRQLPFVGRVPSRGESKPHAPTGQTVTARGATPGTTPHHILRALKGHTEPVARRHRSPRWGECHRGTGRPRVALRSTLGFHRAPRCGVGRARLSRVHAVVISRGAAESAESEAGHD